MQNILGNLPQLSVIQQADAQRWVEGIMRHHASRSEWHAKRLMGIGGSEMGAVVSFYRGERHKGFQSVKEVVQGKLMMRLPDFENWHMRRGNTLEDLGRQVYLARHGAVIDHAATALFIAARKAAGYEFMVGNTDDIVIKNGKRILVDYKVPNVFSETIDFDYEVQLHHYATIAKIAGIRLDGAELVKLDLPPTMTEYLTRSIDGLGAERMTQLAHSIAHMDIPGCRVVALPVELKPSLQAELLAAGKDLWNDYVLKGVVPTPGVTGKLELDEHVEFDLAKYQQQYMMAKSGISHLEKVFKKAQAGITELLSNVDYENKALPLSVVTVKPNKLDDDKIIKEALALGATDDDLLPDKRDYSVQALLEEIQILGGQVNLDHLFNRAFDASKASTFLKDKGVDLSEFRKEGMSIALSQKKDDVKIGEVYRTAAADVFGAWIDESLISNQGHPSEFDADDSSIETYMPIGVTTGHLSEAFANVDETFASEDEKTQKHPMRAYPGLR
ncbi:YqaJ viral recombinase family protein [Pseudomonas veronii]|uniref:YqaJ viral recombinase family protein n=1 Tax=Pseudomonas veronii TaxID=76761 RepID=UPI0015A34B88|nr:YqaJ viral recombinase family protein [Pseudomonas veronii]NWD56910.1 YqaJ viral recombinase family protein [Pseudomonas veronii]